MQSHRASCAPRGHFEELVLHIVHVSSAAALELIRKAKAAGVAITAETCPHYLTFAAAGKNTFPTAPPNSNARRRSAKRKTAIGFGARSATARSISLPAIIRPARRK